MAFVVCDSTEQNVSAALFKAKLYDPKDIIEKSKCDLLKLGLSHTDVKHIYNVSASKLKSCTILPGSELTQCIDARNRWNKLSSGSVVLDRLLRGGVLTRGITELSGQSSCGKTQLCLQLALTVQLPVSSGGLASGAVYICTEDKFPSKRLNQLMKSCSALQNHQDINYGNNIFVEHISDAVELRRCVAERLPKLVEQHHPGLIVIDSVAAIYRADYTAADALQRARDMRALASQLHSLANLHNIAVFCVNQVSDVKQGERSVTVPALGLAWANLVTCRLQMFRHSNTRHLHVVFAPHLPQGYVQYHITAAGIT